MTSYSFLLLFIGQSIPVDNVLFAAQRLSVIEGAEGVFQDAGEVSGNCVPDGAVADAFEVLADQVVNFFSELRQDCVGVFLNSLFLGKAEGVDGWSVEHGVLFRCLFGVENYTISDTKVQHQENTNKVGKMVVV